MCRQRNTKWQAEKYQYGKLQESGTTTRKGRKNVGYQRNKKQQALC
jgi:hypothetical protein